MAALSLAVSIGRSMRRQSETLLLVPLLPIFLIGMFPMLLIGLLGSFGLVIFGVLLVSVGLTSGLEAHGEFNEEVIVHGYARGSERATQASRLHEATRFAALIEVMGLALIAAGVAGIFYLD
jgi:nitrate reductase NapE component